MSFHASYARGRISQTCHLLCGVILETDGLPVVWVRQARRSTSTTVGIGGLGIRSTAMNAKFEVIAFKVVR